MIRRLGTETKYLKMLEKVPILRGRSVTSSKGALYCMAEKAVVYWVSLLSRFRIMIRGLHINVSFVSVILNLFDPLLDEGGKFGVNLA